MLKNPNSQIRHLVAHSMSDSSIQSKCVEKWLIQVNQADTIKSLIILEKVGKSISLAIDEDEKDFQKMLVKEQSGKVDLESSQY